MPRTKSGFVTRRRHKKVLKLAKGYFGAKHALFKTANAQVMKSLSYAYRDRKNRKRDFRKLWITRINAGARLYDLTYSQLIYGLKLANVGINRKMLAELAAQDEQGFQALCVTAKNAIAK